MTAETRWARNYSEDPVTRKLLDRGVKIPLHEELHKAADGFIYSHVKQSLGRENSERLGLHHYAVHVKLGIAQEYLADLTSTLAENRFNLETDPILLFSKLLDGFFVNLLAVFDNITQEINLVNGVGLSRKSSISRLFEMIRASEKRHGLHNEIPPDRKISKMPPVLALPETQRTIDEIGEYRNYLTHNRLPASMTSVSASTTVDFVIEVDRSQVPSRTVAPTHSGGIRFPSRSASDGRAGSDAGTTTDIQPDKGRWRLPRVDKLDVLPSRIQEPDLNPEDITVICERFYTWTIQFLGKVYQTLIEEFKGLP